MEPAPSSMKLLLDVARLLGGGVLLYAGAEALVKGGAGLARAFGVRQVIIGLTVVAYGTSAPELVVTLVAAAAGKGDIALGNVVGSNIANVGLILGVTALIMPPRVDGGLIRREVPALLLAALALPAMLYDGRLSRIDGAILLGGAGVFSWMMLRAARRQPAASPLGREARAEAEHEAPSGAPSPKGVLVALVVGGLAALVVGGKVFVDGAVSLALVVGMSERTVGLTIVAVGTSLPELAASVVAALRGHSGIAVGNVIGSNVFNVALILGTSTLARPIEAPWSAVWLDLLVLVGFTLAAVITLRGDRLITRVEGAFLLAGYAAFLVVVVMR